MPLTPDLSRALADTPDVQWSVRAVDVATGRELCSHDAAVVLPTASVGKVLLLVETARQVEAGELDPAQPLPRLAEDAVQDSGIWQLLAADRLCVDDLAHLVGIVSDNLATNVLLRRVGLDRVQRTADHLGLRHTRLNDRVRDQRGPGDPWTLSEGSASEWVDLLTRLDADAVVNTGVSRRVRSWLRAGADLSMVAQPLGLDPLAHADGDRGMRLWHKTGTDDGTRADVGLLSGPDGTVAYAAIARWDPAGPDRRMPVLAGCTRSVAPSSRRWVGRRTRSEPYPDVTSSVSDRMLPSGSANHATLSPPGAVHTPRLSWAIPGSGRSALRARRARRPSNRCRERPAHDRVGAARVRDSSDAQHRPGALTHQRVGALVAQGHPSVSP